MTPNGIFHRKPFFLFFLENGRYFFIRIALISPLEYKYAKRVCFIMQSFAPHNSLLMLG